MIVKKRDLYRLIVEAILWITALTMLYFSVEECQAIPRHVIKELKAGLNMSIKAPTVLQDNTIKPGEISLGDYQVETGFGGSLAPGAHIDILTGNVTVATGFTYTAIISSQVELGFANSSIVNPNWTGGFQVYDNGILIDGDTWTKSFIKAHAVDLWADQFSISRSTIVPLTSGAHSIVLRLYNDGGSTDNMFYINSKLTTLLIKG